MSDHRLPSDFGRPVRWQAELSECAVFGTPFSDPSAGKCRNRDSANICCDIVIAFGGQLCYRSACRDIVPNFRPS